MLGLMVFLTIEKNFDLVCKLVTPQSQVRVLLSRVHVSHRPKGMGIPRLLVTLI